MKIGIVKEGVSRWENRKAGRRNGRPRGRLAIKMQKTPANLLLVFCKGNHTPDSNIWAVEQNKGKMKGNQASHRALAIPSLRLSSSFTCYVASSRQMGTRSCLRSWVLPRVLALQRQRQWRETLLWHLLCSTQGVEQGDR